MPPRPARRWLLHIHLYLGLACAPYLVIYGLSSLAFNHGWGSEAGGDEAGEVTATSPPSERWSVALEAIAKPPLQRAQSARAQLGVAGDLQAWTLRPQADGSLTFRVTRPGRHYDVTVDASGSSAEIQATRSGWLGVLRGLHGLHHLPYSIWSRSWAFYTYGSLLAIVSCLASGGLLFWQLRRDRGLGFAAFGLGAAGSAAMLFAIFL